MHNEHLIDDSVFDRLVDGHLSDDERRELLLKLDAWPTGWRRCALAFLEAQLWGNELKRLALSPATLALDDRLSPSRTNSPANIAWPGAARWLALAAALLIAFTLGTRQRPAGSMPLAGSASPAIQAGKMATLTPPPMGRQAQRDDDALTLWVRDDSGTQRPLRVPLVDAGTLDREYGVRFQPGLPSTVRDQLQDRGFQVQSRQRYAPLWLENGRPMIVPVEDTKIVPVSENVY